jgi:hypothetical protein
MSILTPRCQTCAAALEGFEGEPYCPDCTAYRLRLPDLQDEPGAEEGYLEWLRELEHFEELADLTAWAQATLPAAVMPCVCTDRRCLRCRVAAIVGV